METKWRKKNMVVRVSAEEWAAIKNAAEEAGIRPAVYVRRRLFTGLAKKAAFDGYKE